MPHYTLTEVPHFTLETLVALGQWAALQPRRRTGAPPKQQTEKATKVGGEARRRSRETNELRG